MKKKLCVFLLSALLCLPIICQAETWAEFVSMVNEAMEGQTGEVVVKAPEKVSGYTIDDEPQNSCLWAPDGVQLIIDGGFFTDMLLGGGDISLRNLTVSSNDSKNGHALQVFSSSTDSKPLSLKLTIEKGSKIVAAGAFNNIDSAIYCETDGDSSSRQTGAEIEICNWGVIDARPAPNGNAIHINLSTQKRKDSLAFRLQNYGTIVDGQCAFDIHLSAVDGDGLAAIENDGAIQSQHLLIRVSSDNTDGSLSFINRGTLSLKGSMALQLFSESSKRTSFIVDNQANGVIHIENDKSPAISIAYANHSAKKVVGEISLHNAGQITCASSPFEVAANIDCLLPFVYSNTGTVISADPDAPTFLVDLSQNVLNKKRVLKEELFKETARKWATNSGFDYLPKGTVMKMILSAECWEPHESFDYGEIILESQGLERPAPTPTPKPKKK